MDGCHSGVWTLELVQGVVLQEISWEAALVQLLEVLAFSHPWRKGQINILKKGMVLIEKFENCKVKQ